MRAAWLGDVPIRDAELSFLPLSSVCPRPAWDDYPSGDRVYFIDCNSEFIKIGTTGILRDRIAALRTGNPYPLEMVAMLRGGRDIERAFQHEFIEYQHSREWFRLEGRLKEFLALPALAQARAPGIPSSVAAGRVRSALFFEEGRS
jgi:hypothetical protein